MGQPEYQPSSLSQQDKVSVKINPCIGFPIPQAPRHHFLNQQPSSDRMRSQPPSQSRSQKHRPLDTSQEFTALHDHLLTDLEKQTQTRSTDQGNQDAETDRCGQSNETTFQSLRIRHLDLPHGPHLGFLPYSMWALSTASCVVLEEERVRVLEWFNVLNCNKPVSNVPSTMVVVEAIWKRKGS